MKVCLILLYLNWVLEHPFETRVYSKEECSDLAEGFRGMGFTVYADSWGNSGGSHVDKVHHSRNAEGSGDRSLSVPARIRRASPGR